MGQFLVAEVGQINSAGDSPESISAQLHSWAQEQKIDVIHIQAGKPQQNACVERYNWTVRYAWLASDLFESIEQVQQEATRSL